MRCDRLTPCPALAKNHKLRVLIVYHTSLFNPTIMLPRMLSLLLLLTCVARKGVADSLDAANLPTETLAPTLLNISRVYNTTLALNSSGTLSLHTLLPYGFHVPNSQIYLRLGFGHPRHRLDPMSMAGLIAIIQHGIVEGIEGQGEDECPGIDWIHNRQRFVWRLDYGFYFEIHNVSGSGRYFTWGQLKDVVEGLRLYLVVGERSYSTKFHFWDGWWRSRLGGGGFIVEEEGVSNQKV